MWASLNTGIIGYRGGPFMAGSQAWKMVVNGKQTHGSRPWQGVDPIVVTAQIINAMQTVVSRQIDITQNPAVVSAGIIKGGMRNNIIPDSVEVIGTIRTFDPEAEATDLRRHEAARGEHRRGERRHGHVRVRRLLRTR